jgi:hypothetical protein
MNAARYPPASAASDPSPFVTGRAERLGACGGEDSVIGPTTNSVPEVEDASTAPTYL